MFLPFKQIESGVVTRNVVYFNYLSAPKSWHKAYDEYKKKGRKKGKKKSGEHAEADFQEQRKEKANAHEEHREN